MARRNILHVAGADAAGLLVGGDCEPGELRKPLLMPPRSSLTGRTCTMGGRPSPGDAMGSYWSFAREARPGEVSRVGLDREMALCVDPTEIRLLCTSQYMHVCQLIRGMERDGELDDTMLLTALLHDLGKVAMLAGEAPENVVCLIEPIEAVEPGSGLDNAIFQFGHDEIAY